MFLSLQSRLVHYGSTFLTILEAGIARGMYTLWATTNTMPDTATLASAIRALGSIAGKEGNSFCNLYTHLSWKYSFMGVLVKGCHSWNNPQHHLYYYCVCDHGGYHDVH